jgi:hypothetical protein
MSSSEDDGTVKSMNVGEACQGGAIIAFGTNPFFVIIIVILIVIAVASFRDTVYGDYDYE